MPEFTKKKAQSNQTTFSHTFNNSHVITEALKKSQEI